MIYKLSLLLLLFSTSLYAQDKEVINILDELSLEYSVLESIEMDLDVHIEYPGRKDQKFTSKIVQQEDNFLFIGPDQEIYCDGQSVWVYLKERNEIHINDFDDEPEDEEVKSPKDLLSLYRSGKYEYSLTEKNNQEYQIEFKPTSRDTEYSKYRLTICKKTNDIQKAVAFGKDGSIVTFVVLNIIKDEPYAKSHFVLNKAKYSGAHIEDLRID